MLEPPEVLGVERVGPEGVTLRLTVKVKPGEQFAVQRALNAAIADAFEDARRPPARRSSRARGRTPARLVAASLAGRGMMDP